MRLIAYTLVLVIAGLVYLALTSYRAKVDAEVLTGPAPVALSEEARRDAERADLIRPLHKLKCPPQSGDWLDRFVEGGETFAQYVQSQENHSLRESYSVIEIQPLGEFNELQRRMIERTSAFMGDFFGVTIRLLEPKPLPTPPAYAARQLNDHDQVLTTWINDDILLPARSEDAMAIIGLVTCDLWPGDLNWVFGAASMSKRVGVWSLHRNGDPHESESAYRLCLLRTLKTATHETGHMLGMPHCAAYECGMNGCRSREENDRRPTEFCPDCQAKIWWTCHADAATRYKNLMLFAEQEGFESQAVAWQKALSRLTTAVE